MQGAEGGRVGVHEQPGGQGPQVGDLGLQVFDGAGVHGEVEGHAEQARLPGGHAGGQLGGVVGGRGLVRVFDPASFGVQAPADSRRARRRRSRVAASGAGTGSMCRATSTRPG